MLKGALTWVMSLFFTWAEAVTVSERFDSPLDIYVLAFLIGLFLFYLDVLDL